MKRSFVQKALVECGILLALVGLVAVLTLLFSFLGTITCGVILAVMLGATRQWTWQTLPISLIAPLILLLMVEISNADIHAGRAPLLALACFAAFWIAYLLTFGLCALEAAPEGAPDALSLQSSASHGLRPCEPHPQPLQSAISPCAPDLPIAIRQLQGRWIQRTDKGRAPETLIEIRSDRLAFFSLDPTGEPLRQSERCLQFEPCGALEALRLGDPSFSAPARGNTDPASPLWIYRVVGETLSVGVNFEPSSSGAPPSLLTFERETVKAPSR